MALIERGYRFGRDFLHFVFPNDTHDEGSWGARCHLPLQLFNGEIIRATIHSLRGNAARTRGKKN
jgi:hypothetical protein